MAPIPSNPFTPSFGTVPLFIAGRDQLIANMRNAFETGMRNPNLSTILAVHGHRQNSPVVSYPERGKAGQMDRR